MSVERIYRARIYRKATVKGPCVAISHDRTNQTATPTSSGEKRQQQPHKREAGWRSHGTHTYTPRALTRNNTDT